jgi:hypothetical protein
MRIRLLLVALMLAAPLSFAGGFLDPGHLDWGEFLLTGYTNSFQSQPKPAVTGAATAANSSAIPIAASSITPEVAHPTADSLPTTGAPRLTHQEFHHE